MKRNIIFGLIVCSGLLMSCSHNQGYFTVLSNQPIDKEHFSLSKGKKHVQVKVDITTIENGINKVLDEGIRREETGDIYVNVQLKNYFYFITNFYANAGWELEGDLIDSSKQGENE